ncbi:Vesicular glutamate transporter 3 [Melipona quadrifasciata]|uniref:Vesicular glutamate transporter 3 n=1 Tax=Melipona quadrifasciata TaxID=166423 RepID=A0A0N0BHJ1_9HYME|nr:Vesicular glutamate transporter 3 [Melipona quadrifasciata]
MSGFAAAGLVAFDSIKSKASQKLAGFRRSNAGYEEFEMPREGSKDNKGFEDERGYSSQASFESLPEPERPPLRHIDTYCKPECPCLSKRYTIATLACIGFIISFGMRCNMGMAKMAMKNATLDNANHTLRFNWTVGTESALDSSFFWGYLVTQVPGGFLASLYPANKIFGAAIAISSFLNLLVPGALSIHPVVDMCVQVMKGLIELDYFSEQFFTRNNYLPGQGVTYPACHASFYFYGICGLIWYCFWLWLAFEKPSKHPCISARELRYIEDSLGQGQAQMPMPTFATTPWRKFLKSMPVHAIIVANFCRSWNFYLLVLFQARFMHEAFGMDLVETGIIGSLPHLLMTMIVPCGGLLADHIRKRGILSTTNVRKLFNCGGFGMEALFFLVVAHATMERNGTAAIFALACGVACSGFAISGFNVNHLDIAPRYASILMGMSNGVGTIAGLLVPFFVDYVTEKKDAQSWRNVFILAACVHIFGVTFYGFFCSGELQPWADPSLEEQKTFAMDEFGQVKPPLPPPPKTMQSEFIKQPSMGDGAVDDWNNYDQQAPAENMYAQQQEKPPVISYGSTETNSNNPFHSTNPFASDINASLVQPPATNDYTYDVTQQNQQWN